MKTERAGSHIFRQMNPVENQFSHICHGNSGTSGSVIQGSRG